MSIDLKQLPLHPKIINEQATIEAMIGIYCRAHHHVREKLCSECRDLLSYAQKRLNHCPFQQDKPTCGKCPVHCYKPEMRKKILEVMRFAGPRMMYHHPLMALRHLLNSRRKAPDKPLKKPRPTDKLPQDKEPRRTSG